MVDVSDILRAFNDWQLCQRELSECYRDTEVSAGYHCYRYAEAEQKSRNKVGILLEAFVDQRIARATAKD